MSEIAKESIRGTIRKPGAFAIVLSLIAVVTGLILWPQRPGPVQASPVHIALPSVKGLAPKDAADILLRYRIESAELADKAMLRAQSADTDNMTHWQTKLAAVFSVFIGGLTIAGALFTQARQAENSTLLKAAEMISGAPNPREAEARAQIATILFKGEISTAKLEDFTVWARQIRSHDVRGLVNLVCGAPDAQTARQRLDWWLAAYPGDLDHEAVARLASAVRQPTELGMPITSRNKDVRDGSSIGP